MAVAENLSGKTTPVSGRSNTLSGDKGSQSRTGRPPTTSILRSAMYYQNRIIIPETKSRQTSGAGNRDTGSVTSSTCGALMNGPNVKSGRPAANNSNNSNFRAGERGDRTITGATSETGFTSAGDPRPRARDVMDARGIDIVVTDTDGANKQHKVKKKKNTLCRRFMRLLRDNRMKGEPNAEIILAVSNPQDFRTLKKVLNISFLTIGIALLVSVIIVIIYSNIGRYTS